MGFETKEFISKEDFLDAAEEALGYANSPDADIEKVVDGAENVAQQLVKVETGSLEVKPPLTDEEKLSLQQRSTTILSVGEKALSSKKKSGLLGKFFRGSQEAHSNESVKGKTAEAKS